MAEYHCADSTKLQALKDIANKLRIHSVRSTSASNSGHPTSCCSAAEIMSVLFFDTMKYKVKTPRDPANDRFVLSKGHAAPILYAAWAEAGLFPVDELLNLRKINSDLEGHPTPRLNFVDVATGSLGQGLSCAAGMAYTGKYFDKADYRVFCLIGDGESAEGSIWEALAFSGHYKLDNLVAIFDINRLGQSEPTALQHDMDTYQKRLESFGWNTYIVDGHDIGCLVKALFEASQVKGKPTCLLAKTFKGKGLQGIEDQDNWHGKPMGAKTDEILAALTANIKNTGSHGLCPTLPSADIPAADISNVKLTEPPNYKLGEAVAIRVAYGAALVKLGKANSRVIALDADTKTSTFAHKFKDACPDRFIECFIAEQNLVAVAIGCATRGRTIAFASTFAVFFTRAFDQIRMGAISQTNVNFVGTHPGISIGVDGAPTMALEDLAMFRSIAGSTCFYPSDAVSAERAVELAANQPGICFIRITRPETTILYKNDEEFSIGKAKIVRQSDNDQVTVIGAGITMREALKAADALAESGINIRVIDPFTIKPIDAETIINSAMSTGGRIVTVEDHFPQGGLGEAVAGAVSEERNIVLRKLAVTGVPRSGPCDALLEMFGISHNHIARAVKEVMKL